ncbi:MAG: DUF5615 family PIN-like protein [Trichodesmium sp. MO_231.B1]|nr:DUF5615 family PIN-like protein [Trichodesmium sp. MO_231.B1]
MSHGCFKQLRRRKPDLVVWAVGEPGTPSKGTLDPDILVWCEVNNFILVTNNRTSILCSFNRSFKGKSSRSRDFYLKCPDEYWRNFR